MSGIYLVIQCDFCKDLFKKSLKSINHNLRASKHIYCSNAHSRIGKKATFKTRRKMSKSRKDKKRPDISERMCGKDNPMYGVRLYGVDNPNYGNHKLAGRNHPNFGKSGMSGENNPMYGIHRYGKDAPAYIDGRTSESIKERNSLRNKQFIQDILKRDSYTCQISGLKSGDRYPDTEFFGKHKCADKRVEIEVDHIKPWSCYPELRYASENCRTLCKPCHKEYGAKPHAKPEKYATLPINRSIFFSKHEQC